LCEIAKKATIAAGEYIQSQFNQQYDKMHKGGGESLASQVVTAVDIKAQEIILEYLEASIVQFDLALLAEEAHDDRSRLKKDYFWCIDPMDGTLAFTEGRTGYAVSIALVSQAGDPQIASVYIPDEGESFTAIKGAGVYLNEKKFERAKNTEVDRLQVYWDLSIQNESYYEQLKKQLSEWASQKGERAEFHLGFGAVRNALGVMKTEKGCYFKFPKTTKGCGSIWDYAATRLFFEELDLPILDSYGKRLALNNPTNTFMNEVGIIYASNKDLAAFIKNLAHKVDITHSSS
jgi:3'(2'), 5'-bisphosphate nucleotidase